MNEINQTQEINKVSYLFEKLIKISGRPNIRIRIRIRPNPVDSVRIRIRPNPPKIRTESESCRKLKSSVENFMKIIFL